MSAERKVIHMDERRSQGPQLEDGYIRIANELFDAMMLKLTSFRHYKVAMAIVRKTYGYGKKTDDITISQLAEITGIHRNNVGTAVRDLERMRVIFPVQAGTYGLILGINKHHSEWIEDAVKRRGPGRKAINLIDSEEGNQIDCKKQSKRCVEAINLIETGNQNVAHKRQPQKTIPKDNSKKIAQSADCAASAAAAFEQFWDAFAYKNGRKRAEAAFAKQWDQHAAEPGWLDTLLNAAKTEAERRDAMKAAGRTPLYAEGWLSQERYNDEDLATWGAFSPEQQAFVDCFNSHIGDTAPQCTEWTERRAALIDIAMRGKWDAERWAQFWEWVSVHCEFRWPVSIDWLLQRDNFVAVKEGKYQRDGGAGE